MNCAELEALLEELAAGALDEGRQTACETHLLGCERCAGLAELATVPVAAGVDGEAGLAADILRRTSGGACDSAEEMLATRGETPLPAAENSLLAVHLTHCDGCRALDRALAALERDLPTLCELSPGPAFVARVMAASLPLGTRLRRWGQRAWPRWVRRPRFALEMAYALTALFVVLFNIPGTPLAAMPRQAIDLARTSPLEALEEPVRDGLLAWEGSSTRQRLRARWDATERGVRTFLDGAASWWENATEDSSSRQSESTEESS